MGSLKFNSGSESERRACDIILRRSACYRLEILSVCQYAFLCIFILHASTRWIMDGHLPINMERVWKSGATVPEAVHDCIHNLVAQTVARQPEAPAVHAWEGGLTYGE